MCVLLTVESKQNQLARKSVLLKENLAFFFSINICASVRVGNFSKDDLVFGKGYLLRTDILMHISLSIPKKCSTENRSYSINKVDGTIEP